MTQGYIIMRGDKLWRAGDDGLLDIVENKLPGTVFGSYAQARNAVRRTVNSWRKLPQSHIVKASDFKIIRVEVI